MLYKLKKIVYDLWFLRYRECPYSGTVRIRLLSPTVNYIGYTVSHIYICITNNVYMRLYRTKEYYITLISTYYQ